MSINELIQDFLRLKRQVKDIFISPAQFAKTPESAPTEDYQVANKKYVDDNAGGGSSYLVYTALLTQSGTNAPVPTVGKNTLGGTPVWSYDGQGSFTATLSGAFTVGKTWISLLPEGSTSGAFVLHGFHTDANIVGYFAYDETWNLVNDAPCWIKIEVYP